MLRAIDSSPTISSPQANSGELHLDERLRSQLANRRILLVDDSRVARKQIANALDHYQLPYFMATDGEEALQLLQQMADLRMEDFPLF